MRVSMLDADAREKAMYQEVYLDGQRLHFALEADDEQGYVVVADADPIPGKPGVSRPKEEFGNPHGVRTRLLRGRVEIRDKSHLFARLGVP